MINEIFGTCNPIPLSVRIFCSLCLFVSWSPYCSENWNERNSTTYLVQWNGQAIFDQHEFAVSRLWIGILVCVSVCVCVSSIRRLYFACYSPMVEVNCYHTRDAVRYSFSHLFLALNCPNQAGFFHHSCYLFLFQTLSHWLIFVGMLCIQDWALHNFFFLFASRFASASLSHS